MPLIPLNKNILSVCLTAFIALLSPSNLLAEGNGLAVSLVQPGTIAPINVLKDTSDEYRSFPVLGKWNMVFYWSLFCHSCIEEMPDLQSKLEEIKDKRVYSVIDTKGNKFVFNEEYIMNYKVEIKDKEFNTYFVSLDSEKMKKGLQNFIKRRRFTAPVLMEKVENEKYITADTWGVTMTPSVFIVNPEGKVVFSHEGPLDIELFFKNLPLELDKK